MTLRRTLIGLTLGVMALTLFTGCVSPGPPPPMVVMETPPPPPPSRPFYFVNVSSLALREGPTTSSPQIGTLQFNDEVQLLDTSSGWGRVIDPRRNMQGWASMRYLQPVPADRPRSAPRRRPPPAPMAPPPPAESPRAM
jgi:hypothetical protein